MAVTGVLELGDIDIDKLMNACDNGVNLSYENWKKENPDADDEDFQDDGEGRFLSGYKKDAEGLYEPDPDAEVSFIFNGDRGTIQVTQSKWITEDASWCSPCYPGQADLGTVGGGVTSYTFGPDWFDEEPVCKPIEYKP